jgi:hypothetical protein
LSSNYSPAVTKTRYAANWLKISQLQAIYPRRNQDSMDGVGSGLYLVGGEMKNRCRTDFNDVFDLPKVKKRW